MSNNSDNNGSAVEGKMLATIARVSSPILLAFAVPGFIWITSSISEMQKTVAVLSDRMAQNTPSYRPADAIRDQALIDQRILTIIDRIARTEKRIDDMGSRSHEERK